MFLPIIAVKERRADRLDPLQNESLAVLDLDENEAAFSVAVVPFAERNNELLLVVGTAKDVVISPRSCSAGFLRLYTIGDDGKSLTYLHKTQVDDVPMCLAAFQGHLLAGVGKALRLYELGKKQLLRKAENKVSCRFIASALFLDLELTSSFTI